MVQAGALAVGRSKPFVGRLVEIHAGLGELLDRAMPDEVAVEGLFEAKNARSALVLGHARGVILLAVASRGHAVHEYAPREVKKAVVGHGNADKEQVRDMVRILLGHPSPIRPLDASDALAIAICHAHSRKLRSFGAVPVSAR